MMYGNGFGGCLGRFAGPNGFSGLGWLGGGFMMMLPLLLLTGFVLYIVLKSNRRNYYQTGTVDSSNSSLEVLKMRYAKGEITDEEFATKKAELLR